MRFACIHQSLSSTTALSSAAAKWRASEMNHVSTLPIRKKETKRELMHHKRMKSELTKAKTVIRTGLNGTNK